MLKVSEAKHPRHRSMTVVAVLATFIDQMKPGRNVVPPVLDDVKTGKVIDVYVLRTAMQNAMGSRKIPTRITKDKELVLFAPGESEIE